MPRLNQLVGTFGAQGLVVVGVTGEDEERTAPWLEQHEARFAVAYEPGLASMRAFGFGGFPSAALVGPGGRVLWMGHPSGLTDETVRRHLP